MVNGRSIYKAGKPVPASACPNCHRDGTLGWHSESKVDARGRVLDAPLTDSHGRALLRFECVCGAAWTTRREEAEAHGKFLQRVSHSVNRSDT